MPFKYKSKHESEYKMFCNNIKDNYPILTTISIYILHFFLSHIQYIVHNKTDMKYSDL